MDFSKVLAVLAQPKEALPPLDHVKRVVLDVPFIGISGEVKARKLKIFLPELAKQPVPLIWVPHYEMGEDALELHDYLAEGWAVSCPTESPADANAHLCGDGVVFNNAALYLLRGMEEFDSERIAVVGGSAGGYTALMLTGMNLGLCTTIANGPIANACFNFLHYFPLSQQLNLPAYMEMMIKEKDEKTEENPALALLQKLGKLPIPFIAALAGGFAPNTERFSERANLTEWETATGVGVADRFSSPLMVNHNTSDVLVPVDQISKRFTYEKPGSSLPENFDMHLPGNLGGKLGCSLEEQLPVDKTVVRRIEVPEGPQPESVLPFDEQKQFNLNIYDDGAPEGYGSHSARMDVGRRIDVPYLKTMFAKTATETNVLTPAMLKFMLYQYNGICAGYPAYSGVDDTLYGSVAVYRKKVRREILWWLSHHSRGHLEQLLQKAISTGDDAQHLAKTLETIVAN